MQIENKRIVDLKSIAYKSFGASIGLLIIFGFFPYTFTSNNFWQSFIYVITEMFEYPIWLYSDHLFGWFYNTLIIQYVILLVLFSRT